MQEQANWFDLARCAASHAIEVALQRSKDPQEILYIAHANYKDILNGDDWPDRRTLH